MEQELIVSEFGLENAHRIRFALEPVRLHAMAHCHRHCRDKDQNPDTQDGSEI